jgi:hypothetical protein
MYVAKWLLRRSFEQRLEDRGVAILRGFLDVAAADRIRRRFENNLRRIMNVFPDMMNNADRGVFPISMPFCDDDSTLPQRMLAASRGELGYLKSTSTEAEWALMREEVGNLLERRLSFLGRPKINEHAVSRFQLARPGSPYDFYALHQDACPALTLHDTAWTAWVALNNCGKDAPSLCYVEKLYKELVPIPEGEWQIDINKIPSAKLERALLNPGDLVVFNAYTIHGTWVTREMTKPRYSLDIRLAA